MSRQIKAPNDMNNDTLRLEIISIKLIALVKHRMK